MGEAADRLQRKLESLIERAAKALILEVNRELRRKGTGTPVDTGHARAAWIPAVGAPNLVEPVGADSSLASAGTAQVMAFKLGGGMLYLSNVAPYIGRLNNGWSQQAPALFVELHRDGDGRSRRRRASTSGSRRVHGRLRRRRGRNLADAFSPFG
jgi:hypothetical protein